MKILVGLNFYFFLMLFVHFQCYVSKNFALGIYNIFYKNLFIAFCSGCTINLYNGPLDSRVKMNAWITWYTSHLISVTHQKQIAVSVQYSRMRHLWRHLVFPSLCNIVVCSTYDFLQKTPSTQKFKMADLDIFHSLQWYNILHFLGKGLYSESK